MANIIGLIGRHAPKAALGQAHSHGWIDLKLGLALLRDQRVSVLAKLASVASGVGLTAVMIALEVPLEGIIGALLPILGIMFDVAFDGIEFLILPVVIGSIVIRWFAPKHVVDELRR